MIRSWWHKQWCHGIRDTKSHMRLRWTNVAYLRDKEILSSDCQSVIYRHFSAAFIDLQTPDRLWGDHIHQSGEEAYFFKLELSHNRCSRWCGCYIDLWSDLNRRQPAWISGILCMSEFDPSARDNDPAWDGSSIQSLRMFRCNQGESTCMWW